MADQAAQEQASGGTLPARAPETAAPDRTPAPVPYDRFNEVVRERNKLRQDLEALGGQHKSASDQLAATMAELAAAKAAALRTQAAARTGLPLDLADRLQGADEAALAEDAARLAAYLRPVSPGVPPAGGGAPVLPLDVSKMTPAEIREHQREIMQQQRGGK